MIIPRHSPANSRRRIALRAALNFAVLTGLVLVGTGCSHSGDTGRQISTPPPPPNPAAMPLPANIPPAQQAQIRQQQAQAMAQAEQQRQRDQAAQHK